MARRMFDFKCDEGHITEKYIGYETITVECDVCSKAANRIVSPVRVSLDGSDPVYVTAHEKWAKRHEDAAKAERKRSVG